MKTEDLSFSEAICVLFQRSSDKQFTTAAAPVVRSLLGSGLSEDALPVKKYAYDKSIIRMAAELETSVSNADVVKAMFAVSKPFPSIWMQGTYNVIPGDAAYERDQNCDLGALLKFGDEDIEIIKVRNYNVDALEAALSSPLPKDRSLNGKMPSIERCVITRDEINLSLSRDDRAKDYNSFYERHGILVDAGASYEESLADFYFFTRLFVLARSHVAKGYLWKADKPVDLAIRQAEYKRNLARRRMGRPPAFAAIPIVINVTNDSLAAAVLKLGEAPELLGWTSVSQSKPWRSRKTGELLRNKDGELIYTRAHDRKIATPEDRRNAERRLTATRPARLDVRGDYPTLKTGPK